MGTMTQICLIINNWSWATALATWAHAPTKDDHDYQPTFTSMIRVDSRLLGVAMLNSVCNRAYSQLQVKTLQNNQVIEQSQSFGFGKRIAFRR